MENCLGAGVELRRGGYLPRPAGPVADEARFCASAKRIAGVCHAGGAVARARAFFADRGGESGEVAEDHAGRPRGRAVAAGIAAGADFGYVGSAFIATDEANASEAYKAAIVDGAAQDIVYSNLFTGVHGNYLKPSVVNAGLDPDNLLESDPTKMNFGGEQASKKAWKDIWGCGQGIAPITAVHKTADVVDRYVAEFQAAKARLAAA